MDACPEPPAKHNQLSVNEGSTTLDGKKIGFGMFNRLDVVKPAKPENTERQRCAGVKASRVILSTSAKRNVESIHVQKYPR